MSNGSHSGSIFKPENNFFFLAKMGARDLWGSEILSLKKTKFFSGLKVPIPRVSAITTYMCNVKYVLKRVSFGSKDCTKELKLECAYFLGQTS